MQAESKGGAEQIARIMLLIEAFEKPYIEAERKRYEAAFAERAARIDALIAGR